MNDLLPPLPPPPLDLSRFHNPAPGDIPTLRLELAAIAAETRDAFLLEDILDVAKTHLKTTKGAFDRAVKSIRKESRGDIAFDHSRVEGLYYDSQKNYYRRVPDGGWDLMGVEQTRRHLRVELGISDLASQGGISEIDYALHHIETRQRVHGALPFPLQTESVVAWNGKSYLNTSNLKLMEPAEGSANGWGDGFPKLAQAFEVFLPNPKALDMWNAWLRVWYKRVRANGCGGRGQALFILGPVQTGKTYMTNIVLKTIFGAVEDASKFFAEGSQFNSELFESPVWALDDAALANTQDARSKFSALVKKAVANPAFPYEKKYGFSGTVPFNGRLTITLNDGPSSVSILPDTDQDLLDKVIMLRSGSTRMNLAPTEAERAEVLKREIPYYLRWLEQTPHAAWVKAEDGRCEINSWHDDWVLDQATQNSSSEGAAGALIEWINYVKSADLKGQSHWTGSVEELFSIMKDNSVSKHLMAGAKTPATFSKQLRKATAMGRVNIQWLGVIDATKRSMMQVALK